MGACFWKHSSRDRGPRRVWGRSQGPDESLKPLFAHNRELTDRGEEGQQGQRATNALSAVTSDRGINLREGCTLGHLVKMCQ